MKTLFSLTEESINFQHGDLIVKQMDLFFQGLQDYIKDTDKKLTNKVLYSDNKKAFSDIENAINKRFGSHISLNVTNQAEAFMSIFFLPVIKGYERISFSDVSAFFKDSDKVKLEKLLDDLKTSNLEVDLENAKINNLPKSYSGNLSMDFVKLFKELDMQPEELTAIALHEIGHYFDSIALLYTTTKQSRKILSARKKLDKGADTKKFKLAFIEAAENDTLKADIEKIKSDNMVVFGISVINLFINDGLSLIKNSNYGNTVDETYADDFVAKFNRGVDLSSGLVKLNNSTAVTYNRITILNNISFIIAIIFFSLLIFMSSIVIFSSLTATASIFTTADLFVIFGVGLFLSFANLFGLLFMNGESVKDYGYDDIKVRIAKLKRSLIEEIKNQTLDKKQTKALIDAIKKIEKNIDKAIELKNPLVGKIANILFSKNRIMKKTHDIEILLETFVNNDLFVREAELKTMA